MQSYFNDDFSQIFQKNNLFLGFEPQIDPQPNFSQICICWDQMAPITINRLKFYSNTNLIKIQKLILKILVALYFLEAP